MSVALSPKFRTLDRCLLLIVCSTHTGELSGLKVQEGAKGTRASGRIREDLLEQRRQARGPSQPVVEKGSIVIRDLRLWHAGMPNMTEEVRVMLAMSRYSLPLS